MRRTRRGETVLTISDLHCPFQHKQALEFLLDTKAKYKPAKVVCLGDHGDAYAWSPYPKSPDADGQAAELAKTRRELAKFTKAFPTVSVCDSNHVRRYYRGVTALLAKTPAEILGTPQGWQYAESWVIDGVRYFHGDGYAGPTGALEAATAYRQSVVIGHLHSFGGVVWSAGPNDQIFGANAGCLVDQAALAFQYAKDYKHRPTLGTVVVDRGVPVFEPMWR